MRSAALALTLILVACGGKGGGGPQGGEFQLTASGVTPVTLTIANGGTVTFTNKDAAPHQITSGCAELASSSLATDQSFSVALGGPKTCSFSDSLNPSNSAFTGTISVDAPVPGY